MVINIRLFGVVRELIGNSDIKLEVLDGAKVTDLKIALEQQYPTMKKIRTYLVALENKYASDDDIILPNKEIAIIPPVNGG